MASLSGSRVEDNGLIEERPIPLLDALEGRADTLLRLWRQERESRQALQQRLDELEAAHLALTEKSQQLVEKNHQLVEKSHQLLEERRELEASRLELVEENRELDEQNRELEEHNRHLHERLSEQREGQASGFPRPARRSQGLSALIGRRTVPTADSAQAPATPEELPAGEGLSEEISQEVDRAKGGVSGAASVASQEEGSPAPTVAGQQDSLAIGEAPSPHTLLAEWYQRYPAAFFKGHTRPLKVGIHEELAAREPWPEKLVRRALACYVNLPRYLKAVREGAERIDLAGQPAGGVDAQAAEHARKKLDRLQAERRGKVPTGAARRQEAGPGRPRPGSKSADKPLSKSGDGQGDRQEDRQEDRKARFKAGPSREAPATGGDAARPSAFKAATKPQPAAESRPVTMEEKLAALVAKHRHS
ncbi:ProQ/FINO family protein [Halomonas sp. PGE1]|uniref:ProQ/FINO family protein n=1 Tax=Halomonas sp. PGE1 TaxID=2730360 RepID=UPI001B8D7E32|nr:ProQ/FINO family protein [Halomonas sp. PGE1]